VDPFRGSERPAVGAVTGIAGVERLGVDTLVWETGRLIVRSPREMPTWRVGKNRKTAVHFRGQRYAVVATYAELAKYEYTLEPWPERAHELPARDIHYDEAYVRDREDEARMRETARRQSFGLAPLWPVLGFLPLRTKVRLHLRFGLEPIAATRRSVLLEFVVLAVLFVFSITGMDVFTFKPTWGIRTTVTMGLTLLDTLARVSILVDDDFPTFGLFEWVLHPDLVRLMKRGWSRVLRGRRR
jgi:hypothetical protein